MQDDNIYSDLSTYPEIYQELIYQRNETISRLGTSSMLNRNRQTDRSDADEWKRHQSVGAFRSVFRENILHLVDRLYSHDAIEAVYDFRAVDLGDWSDTEANRLERELQQLQKIISKLETRYQLQYQLIFEYVDSECTLYLNTLKVFSCGSSTLRHRLLSTLFSEPHKSWDNDDIEKYFMKHFNYARGELSDNNIEKAAKDIQKDVAAKTAVRNLLIVSKTTVHINPAYLS